MPRRLRAEGPVMALVPSTAREVQMCLPLRSTVYVVLCILAVLAQVSDWVKHAVFVFRSPGHVQCGVQYLSSVLLPRIRTRFLRLGGVRAMTTLVGIQHRLRLWPANATTTKHSGAALRTSHLVEPY